MKKAFLLVFVAAIAIGAQTNFPVPPGIPLYTANATILGAINIGDFDGDGVDDIALGWDSHQGYGDFWTIYSIKKGTYLMIDTSNHYDNNQSYGTQIAFGHLTSTPTNWVAIGSTYYIWNGSPVLGKKKAQP
jgi:hypothetical protein